MSLVGYLLLDVLTLLSQVLLDASADDGLPHNGLHTIHQPLILRALHGMNNSSCFTSLRRIIIRIMARVKWLCFKSSILSKDRYSAKQFKLLLVSFLLLVFTGFYWFKIILLIFTGFVKIVFPDFFL